jgi:1A family penicillin-binding protein
MPKSSNKYISQESTPSQALPKKKKPSVTKKGRYSPRLKFPKVKLLLFISVLLVLSLTAYFTILRDLPSPSQLKTREIAQTTKIFDRNGELLYEIYAQENRTIVPLSQIPDYLKKATISIEDKDFYKHSGFDIRGIIRAVVGISLYHRLQGGSTITQQLIKSALLSPERTLQRKIKEFLLAALVEHRYKKDEILEMYLNQVPYGGTAWGIEAAANTYFGKHAKDLTLAESSLLAGLPAAPTYYSPFGAHPEFAKTRQSEVLRRMTEDKYISSEEAERTRNEPLKFALRKTDIKAPHFVLYVKDLLTKKYGEKLVEQGGLKVTTTLDYKIQEFAQTTIASEVAKLKDLRVGNGAALVTKPKTGEIIAMVGSRDYFDTEYDGNVNVTLAFRQPGSSIKPINYAVGLLKGYSPATVFIDVPTCFSNPGQKAYCPVNYDGKFHGVVQMRFALGNSYNIPAVKMLALNTVHDMIATASAMGISTLTDESRYGLSLTLGGGEVTMIDMAKAFGVFANSGLRQELTTILKVEDAKENVIEEFKPKVGKEVLPAGVTYLISHILLDNNARAAAFGTNSFLVIPNHAVSVKTGTTDDKRDNWTIGYTPSFLTTVWVGNNDNTPMNPYLTSGITGAAPIWNKIMSYVLKDQPEQWPSRPENITGLSICALTGRLPGDSNCPTRYEYFIRGTEPKEVENNQKTPIPIDKTTNQPAKEGQTDNVEVKEEQIISDPFTKNFCVTCPIPGS